MHRNVTSQNQHRFWSHLFSVIVSIVAGVVIYWISGGFPPTTWQTLWLVLSQVQVLWRHGATALVLQLVILGIQSLLLLFVWLVCLWIICIEAIAFVKYVFEPVLLRYPVLSDLVDSLYFAMRLPLRIFSREQTDSISSVADSSLALSRASDFAPPPGVAERLGQEGEASHTISPFAPDHSRWFPQSPDPFAAGLQKIFSGNLPTFSAQGGSAISDDSSKSLSQEAILQNPFEEPKEEILQNPFEQPKEEVQWNPFGKPREEILWNPFEEPEGERLQNSFEQPFTGRSDVADQKTLASTNNLSMQSKEQDVADQETLVPTNDPSTQSEEQNDSAAPSALPDDAFREDNTATLSEDLDTIGDTPVFAKSTSTQTRSPGQSFLVGYCAQPEETEGDTAHLELSAARTISAGVQLLSGLYVIVSGPGEAGADDTISSQVVKTMRERLEPLQNGTCSNEELKELFFVTGQHVYEQFLQGTQKQGGGQKKNYTLTGVLVLQEPDADAVSYIAHVVHCGSSQLYCYSASKGLTRITNEEEVETLLTQQALATEEGQLVASQSEGSSWNLEVSMMTKISTFSLPLQPRDRLLLCGSGLWNSLLDRELTAFLALPVRNPMQIATLLQQAAIEANHKKQIMAMVVFIPE